jgi:hypothetical protein
MGRPSALAARATCHRAERSWPSDTEIEPRTFQSARLRMHNFRGELYRLQVNCYRVHRMARRATRKPNLHRHQGCQAPRCHGFGAQGRCKSALLVQMGTSRGPLVNALNWQAHAFHASNSVPYHRVLDELPVLPNYNCGAWDYYPRPASSSHIWNDVFEDFMYAAHV